MSLGERQEMFRSEELLTRYRPGLPPRDDEEREAYREWRQLDADVSHRTLLTWSPTASCSRPPAGAGILPYLPAPDQCHERAPRDVRTAGRPRGDPHRGQPSHT